MEKLFGFGLLLIFLSGCASQTLNESEINIAIENNDLKKLQGYSDNPYVISGSLEIPRPGFTEFSNAMEAAIYLRNIEAVGYLASIGAKNKVSVHYYQYPNWQRTPANIPAAELACGVGAFEIMELLLQKYPDDKPDYTNCLHYLVSNYMYYPSAEYQSARRGPYFRKNDPALRSWRTQAYQAQAVQKVIGLGAAHDKLPTYGTAMYAAILDDPGNAVLSTLLKNGLNPNQEYSCMYSVGTCRFLIDISRYKNENLARERAKLLAEYGADLDAVIDTPVIIGLNEHSGFQYGQQSVTALHMAKYFEKEYIADTLVGLGANKDTLNKNGKTAEQYSLRFAPIAAAQKRAANKAMATMRQEEGSNSNADGSSVMGLMPAAGSLIDVLL
ncbi:ankyrin repeat domain-containing protein [Marinobacter salexigens]|uniref:Ankyrin repeat domain-containing protein n=1 Tax=Marinobacter salexigens TaxID=1925763 RepID=A0ABS6A8U7_9GAMM|nr:ankyrin repeat domain-containing protein [Marinobacter salexigens]MBU2874179.1 ankyrin repeat domain-containing protein [Marinobacter salexigens]